jgi:hypothetical protein
MTSLVLALCTESASKLFRGVFILFRQLNW